MFRLLVRHRRMDIIWDLRFGIWDFRLVSSVHVFFHRPSVDFKSPGGFYIGTGMLIYKFTVIAAKSLKAEGPLPE